MRFYVSLLTLGHQLSLLFLGGRRRARRMGQHAVFALDGRCA